MSAKKEHRLLHAIVIIITMILFLLGYVGLKLRIDSLKKEIVVTNDKIKQLQNKQIKLLADEQFLGAEDRVVPLAADELQLERKAPMFVISVSQSEIDRIKNEVAADE